MLGGFGFQSVFRAASVWPILFAFCGCATTGGNEASWPQEAAVHVSGPGSSTELAAVKVMAGIKIRPEGIERRDRFGAKVSPSMPVLVDSGFGGGWFFLQPGRHRLQARAAFMSKNEVPVEVTLEPGAVYLLGKTPSNEPDFRLVAPGDPVFTEHSTLRSSAVDPPSPALAPGVRALQGVRLSMFKHTREIRLDRRGSRVVLDVEPYSGMPFYVPAIATDARSWDWSVFIPPDLGGMGTIETSATPGVWHLCDFMPAGTGVVVCSNSQIISLPVTGWRDTRSLLRAGEVNTAWKGEDWRLRQARIASDGGAVVFNACPWHLPNKEKWRCRIGRKDLATQAISDLGRGDRMALAPDDGSVAIASIGLDARAELRIVTVADGRERIFPTGGHKPSSLDWSPNGKDVAFSSDADGNVFVLRLETGHVVPVTQAKSPGANCGSPAWAPDGRLFVVCSTNRGWSDVIWSLQPAP